MGQRPTLHAVRPTLHAGADDASGTVNATLPPRTFAGVRQVPYDADTIATGADGFREAAELDLLQSLVEVSADGLVVLDEGGRILSLNAAGARILGSSTASLVGQVSPFKCSHLMPVTDRRRRTTWLTPNGRRRDLEYRGTRLPDGRYAVWFSDVTDTLRQQERLTAIIRAASSVARAGSLRATLDAVANEVLKTTSIAAAQILVLDDPGDELRVLGLAGFGNAPDFTERLSACRRLGVRARFIDAFRHRKPVVVLHRKPAVMADPAWAPLHEIMDRPHWDSFAATPLVVRGRAVGVLNAFYVPGEDPGPHSLHFLEAMADHAAVAVDTAMLLAKTRSEAESDERRRLARDLHDSVAQQLFSMRMQAKALRTQLARDDVSSLRLRGAVEELSELSESALVDLRGLVFELRPLDLTARGFVEAVRAHAASVEARSGLRVEVHAPATLELRADVEEDLFRVVQEALHNVVKHARATTVEVVVSAPPDNGDTVVEVTDDGRGQAGTARTSAGGAAVSSLGLVSMRERVQRWGGSLRAGPRPAGGWTVQVTLPGSGRGAQRETH